MLSLCTTFTFAFQWWSAINTYIGWLLGHLQVVWSGNYNGSPLQASTPERPIGSRGIEEETSLAGRGAAAASSSSFAIEHRIVSIKQSNTGIMREYNSLRGGGCGGQKPDRCGRDGERGRTWRESEKLCICWSTTNRKAQQRLLPLESLCARTKRRKHTARMMAPSKRVCPFSNCGMQR